MDRIALLPQSVASTAGKALTPAHHDLLQLLAEAAVDQLLTAAARECRRRWNSRPLERRRCACCEAE